MVQQQGVNPLEISGLRFYFEEMRRGTFALDGGVTTVLEDLTGQPAESFETTARRYAAMPFARQSFRNRVKAFARFNAVARGASSPHDLAAAHADPTPSRRSECVMRSLENRVPPPLLTLIVGAVMAVSLLDPAPVELPLGWRWALAGVFFAAAGLFGFPAFAAFVTAKTTINPVDVDRASTLVTTGVYRVTRNPMYVGLTLLLCAWAAWLARPWPLIGPVAFVLFINRFQIVPEERALMAKFGDAYAVYRRSVRRRL